MPISKRDKRISLTKTDKKVGNKSALVNKVLDDANHPYFQIQSLVSNYKYIYVTTFENPRNARLAEIRQELPSSVLLFGKNKVIAVAFGRDATTQLKPGLHKLKKYVKGQCALLFSDMELDELRQVFNQFRSQDYARAGSVAAQTVTLGAGPVPKFSYTLEPSLRQLGLPVKLVRGIINLEDDYLVCNMGQALTPEQCRILKYFETQTSEFRVNIVARWKAENGSVENLSIRDAENVVTSLYPKVRVTCQTIEAGSHCFIPEPMEV